MKPSDFLTNDPTVCVMVRLLLTRMLLNTIQWPSRRKYSPAGVFATLAMAHPSISSDTVTSRSRLFGTRFGQLLHTRLCLFWR